MNVNTIFKRRYYFKTRFAIFYAFLSLICFFSGTLEAQTFDRTKDIIVAQFDNKEDADDIHSQAGFACIMMHPDAKDVNYYAVAGAYGKQPGEFLDSRSLFNMAFGIENGFWTDAHKDRSGSVTRIKDKVKPILLAGGKAWVQEAGQSDVTLLWIKALLADGVPAATVKNNVIIVQHSGWNEQQASDGVLDEVKLKATYIKIADGNKENATPGYNSKTTTYMTEVLSSENKNSFARDIWAEADKIIKASGFNANYSPIPDGGIDFSDDVEVWYILGLGDNAFTIRKFLDRYVVNESPNIPVTGVLLTDKPTTTLAPSTSFQLTAIISPNFASNRAVTWTSSNTAIASVSSTGLVTAKSAGTSTITVKTNDGGYKATYDVVVKSAPPGTVFLEENGLVVMEVESAPLVGKWERRTLIPGFSGTSYYHAMADHFSVGGTDALNYTFTITTAGIYQVQVRSRIAEGSSFTDFNDTWVRLIYSNFNSKTPVANSNIVTGTWYKYYMNIENTWTWNTSNKDNDPKSLSWDLPAGKYTIQLSMRSLGHAVDKIVLWNKSKYNFADSTGRGTNLATIDALPTSKEANPFCWTKGHDAGWDLSKPARYEAIGVVEPARNAIQINTLQQPHNEWAAAKLVYANEAGVYNVIITTLQETDGESSYRVFVNGKKVLEFQNPRILGSTTPDYTPYTVGVKRISVPKNARIQLDFKSNSNGLVPEGAGFAWARARWRSLSLGTCNSTYVDKWLSDKPKAIDGKNVGKVIK